MFSPFLKPRLTLNFLLALLLTSGWIQAAPYFGERAFTYRQPDGETFQVRLYGDEFFAYEETEDGYLVIRDPNNGLMCYANVTPDGTDIVSTGVRVGQAKPAGLKPKQRLGPHMAMKKSLGNRNLLGVDEKGRRNPGKKLKAGKGREILNVAIDETAVQSAPADGSTTGTDPIVQPGPPPAPTLNQRVGLVLLASFPDRPADITKTVADIDDYCNAEVYTAGGNATSIYGYFKIQSNGKLSYKNNVTAWFTAANPRSYYTDEAIPHGTRATELLKEGLAVLKAKGFDFTQCDANNDGKLDGVNIFHAGAGINNWAKGLWPHQSSTSWTGLTGTGLTSTSFEYQMTDMPANITIGTFCHENGHMICDFPDLYSYDGNAANMGGFSLMASSGTTHPRHVDPYLKIHAGWADVVDLTSSSQLLCAVQQDRNFFYRYKNPAKATEYFLFEVRGTAGYEGAWGGAGATNPANGLVIYHANQTGSNTYSTIITADAVTNYTKPYELMVVEAAPSTAVIPWYDDPTPGTNDAFSAPPGVSAIPDVATPADLNFWAADGRTVASGANINSISAAGQTMTFIAGAGALPAIPATNVTATQFQPNVDFGKNAASQIFSVFNGGGGTLTYTVSDNAAWLACAPASGTATTEADLITVSYTTSGLAAGTHSGTITIDGGAAGIKTIGVTLTVNQQPTLSATPGSFSLAGIAGTTITTVSFNLSNPGGGTAAYALSKTKAWLTLDRTSGTVSSEQDLVAVTVNATSLVPGVYNDTITITSAEATNSPLTIPVTFTVDGPDMIVTAPDGGEFFLAGASTTITWLSPLSGNAKIELLSNGAVVSVIASSTPNNGSYGWTIPTDTVLGSNYRVRVTSLSDPSKFDTSNANFTISEQLSFYQQPMNTNPGWTLGGTWAYGAPTGGTAPRPSAGFTGANVLGDNLAGDYAPSLTIPSYATTTAIDCSGYGNVQLSFYRWLRVENSSWDHATLLVSNNGANWTEIWHNPSDANVADSNWTLVTYDISAIADGQPTVYIRWGIGPSDSSVQFAGWHIDDVALTGYRTVFNDTLLTLNLASSTVSEAAGTGATTGIVSRMGTSGDLVVSLASSNTSKITVPASVTILNGQTASPPFNVNAVDNLVIESTQTVIITSSAAGYQPGTAGIDVTDNDNTPPVVDAGLPQTINLTGSAWSPLTLAPKLWLDAADTATITLNGATVSQWADKSGLNRHATQFTAGNQPANTPTGLNGKRVLTFDGSNDFFSVDLDFLANVSHSAFIVTKPTIYSNIYGAATAGAGANSLHVGFASAANYRMNFWANDYGPAPTANFRAGSANILNYAWTSGVGKQIFANGSSEGSNTNAGTIGTMSGGGRIGHTTTASHGAFGGDIAEFVILTGTVNLADRESLEGYLAHKWGLTGWLPTNHPYKTTGPNNAEAVANLDGTTSDANGHTLTHAWASVSGPAAVVFGNADSVDTTATFTTEGVYTLSLTAADGFTQTTDNVVITVGPALAGYNVTYSGNNSTGGTVPVDGSNPHNDGTTVTVLGNTGTLVRAGYTFNNWNTAANGSGTSYAAGATFTISAHTTLYAQWTANNYTVTLNSQSGTGGTASVTASSGSAMPTATAPSRTGYTFGGYYTQVSGGGTQYYNAAMASSRNWDIPWNAILYAKWTANNYTVTFESVGGTAVAPITQAVGTAVTPPVSPTKLGYSFTGWTPVVPATMPAADTICVAQWSANSYTITFDSAGGTAVVSITQAYGTAVTTPADPTKTGYTFAGWVPAVPATMPTDTTCVAQWTANSYIVTFDKQTGIGGSDSVSATYGSAMPAAIAPTRIGYTFGGYYTEVNGTGTQYYTAAMTSAATWNLVDATTLYAKWFLGADGTWNQTIAGPFNWGDTANWFGGVVAEGTDKTASFTPNITAAQTVNLEAAHTIGNITFTDSTTASHDLTISGANILTLARSSGTPVINVTQSGRKLTISSQISGSNGLKKDGAGNLTLSGANDYTGGTVINAGTIAFTTDANFGATSGGLTFAGTGGISYADLKVLNVNRTFTINTGVSLTLGANLTVNGIFAGSGNLLVNTPDGFYFPNPNNTFSGTITSSSGETTGYGLEMASIGDLVGAGLINLNAGSFRWIKASAGTTTFINRQFALSGTTGGGIISARGSSSAENLIVIKDLLVTGDGNKTFTLAGPNTGSNTFAGNIANGNVGGTTDVISLMKSEAGTWILSGTNTYSGATQFSGQNCGTLIFSGAAAVSSNSTFQLREGCTLGLRDDTAGTVTFGAPMQVNLQSQQTSGRANSTINVNRISTGSGNTLAIGKLNYAGITDNRAGGATVNVTGANGYKLQIASIDLDWGINGSQNLNPTTASIIVTGTVKHTNGRPVTGTTVEGVAVGTGGMAFVLDGTATGNVISGDVKNATDFDDSSNVNALPLNLTKTNTTGVWTLTGANTYTGTTTVSGGTLEIGGGGTLGSGNYAGNISIISANSGNLKYNSTTNQTLVGVISGTGALVKDNSGILTLTNVNTYTGTTTVTAGKLFINGNQTSATGAISVAVNATLGGSGTIGGSPTIASSGKLEFDISTAAASHTPLTIVTGKVLTLPAAGASTLTITSSGGGATGIYTLVTGGNNIAGTVPATVNLPAGWIATVSISGNNLLLNVTSVTGTTYAVTYDGNGKTGGSVPVDGTNYANGATVTVLGNTGSLVKTGYTFAGWNTAADGNGTLYSPPATFTINANTTLYAKWNATLYTVWSGGSFAGTFTDTALISNPDGDTLTNLQEFAFGMDPTTAAAGPLVYEVDGNVVTAGCPILQNFAAVGQPADYRAVFARRKNHIAAGLTYTVYFSSDMGIWTQSAVAPTRQTGAVSSGNMEAVSVPFPTTVPLPKFFRVAVTQN